MGAARIFSTSDAEGRSLLRDFDRPTQQKHGMKDGRVSSEMERSKWLEMLTIAKAGEESLALQR